jgi:hypothetical protein
MLLQPQTGAECKGREDELLNDKQLSLCAQQILIYWTKQKNFQWVTAICKINNFCLGQSSSLLATSAQKPSYATDCTSTLGQFWVTLLRAPRNVNMPRWLCINRECMVIATAMEIRNTIKYSAAKQFKMYIIYILNINSNGNKKVWV